MCASDIITQRNNSAVAAAGSDNFVSLDDMIQCKECGNYVPSLNIAIHMARHEAQRAHKTTCTPTSTKTSTPSIISRSPPALPTAPRRTFATLPHPPSPATTPKKKPEKKARKVKKQKDRGHTLGEGKGPVVSHTNDNTHNKSNKNRESSTLQGQASSNNNRESSFIEEEKKDEEEVVFYSKQQKKHQSNSNNQKNNPLFQQYTHHDTTTVASEASSALPSSSVASVFDSDFYATHVYEETTRRADSVRKERLVGDFSSHLINANNDNENDAMLYVSYCPRCTLFIPSNQENATCCNGCKYHGKDLKVMKIDDQSSIDLKKKKKKGKAGNKKKETDNDKKKRASNKRVQKYSPYHCSRDGEEERGFAALGLESLDKAGELAESWFSSQYDRFLQWTQESETNNKEGEEKNKPAVVPTIKELRTRRDNILMQCEEEASKAQLAKQKQQQELNISVIKESKQTTKKKKRTSKSKTNENDEKKSKQKDSQALVPRSRAPSSSTTTNNRNWEIVKRITISNDIERDIVFLGLNRWKNDIRSLLLSYTTVDDVSGLVVHDLGREIKWTFHKYATKEILSLLELAIWKQNCIYHNLEDVNDLCNSVFASFYEMNMYVFYDDQFDPVKYRQERRNKDEIDIIIRNVLPFLGNIMPASLRHL